MKVLFIHPQIRTLEPPRHPPYGLLQLCALTDEYGFKVGIIDNNAFRLPIDAVRQTIKQETWDIIGIGGLISQFNHIEKLLPMCREENPAATIIAGGGFLTSMPHEMMRWLPDFDLGVIGEAYNTWREILEKVEQEQFDWKRVKGVIYRVGKRTKFSPMRPLIEEYYYCEEHSSEHFTFDTAQKASFKCKCGKPLVNNLDVMIPWPMYEIAPIGPDQRSPLYLTYSQMPYSPECMRPGFDPMIGTRRLDVLTSYGCPWQCNFCFHNGQTAFCQSQIYGKPIKGKAFRQHSPRYVVDLITHLRLKYCINFVSFTDENLTVNRKWFFEFCSLLEESGLALDINWGMVCHVRTVDHELLRKARDVGCSYISYGGETSSEKLLKQIGKGQNKIQMEAALAATQAAGINPIMSWIIGHPGSTIDDLIEDCQFFVDNRIHANPFFLQPYPGSKLYKKHKEQIIDWYLTEEESELHLKQAATRSKKMMAKISQIRDEALKRWIMSLDDATKLSINLTDFNDVELAGLRYMLFSWDLKRLKEFKKQKKTNNE